MSKALRRVQSTALNPNVVGTIHFLLTKAPARIREPLVNILTTRIGATATARLIKVLGWLTAIAIVKRINEKLNSWALNNWQWKTKKDDWTWSWEIAVVTGGCSGIGKEIVKGLIEKDVNVAIFDIQPLPVEFEKSTFLRDLFNKTISLTACGTERKITYVKCDVTSPAAIAEAAKFVRSELGDPTILVNNAGVGSPHSILETSNEWVTKIFQINIISHFWLTKEFLPHMIKKNKGHIVGLASLASFVAPPAIVDYASTKAAVMAFHEGDYVWQQLKNT
jgi:NADP-dependent 3-hydroxy acid dehydrogenase YdfG